MPLSCAAPGCSVLGYQSAAVTRVAKAPSPSQKGWSRKEGMLCRPRAGKAAGRVEQAELSSVPGEEQLPRTIPNCSCEMYLQKRLFVQSTADKQTPVLPGTLCNRWGLGTLQCNHWRPHLYCGYQPCAGLDGV